MFARTSEGPRDLRRLLHEVAQAVSKEAISAPDVPMYQLEASIRLTKRVLELEDGYRARSSQPTIDQLTSEACAAAIRAVRLSNAALVDDAEREKTSSGTPVWHGPCSRSRAVFSTL